MRRRGATASGGGGEGEEGECLMVKGRKPSGAGESPPERGKRGAGEGVAREASEGGKAGERATGKRSDGGRARGRVRNVAAAESPRKGPRTVMATGVFDILHLGHLYYLTEAKKLGDRLVVVVARDETARRLKRQPIVPEHLRLEMVRALKPVDEAVLGDREDFYRVVKEIDPDVIALGHDQAHDPEKIKRELAERGLRAEVVRLPCLKHDLMATRRIIERILEAFGRRAGGGALEGVEE
ncbi:MAG: adenylyltransferase/cytidyltransferase family protein [Thermoplasmata archaeon]